jgi:hypothetical protein
MDESKTRSERIRELIGIYGADFDRWPATEGLGRPVLDAELQKLRNEEDELDLLIAGAVVPDPSADLRRRILDIPERRGRQNAWNGLWIVSGFWRPASIAVCALLVGLFVGQLTLVQAGALSLDVAADTETEMLFADLMLGSTDILSEIPQ